MNVKHLFDCLQKNWKSITVEQLEKIANRMPKLCQAIITAKGE